MALALVGAALLVVPVVWRRGARRRLGRLRRVGLPASEKAATPAPDAGRIAIALVAGAAVAGLIWAWWGVPVGLATGVAVERYLRRQEPPAQRRERLAAMADLPLGADLLAAALRAGAPIDRAAGAVADALGGPLGQRLQRTARSLRLGADPAEAWAHGAGVTGADRLIPAAGGGTATRGGRARAPGRRGHRPRAARGT